jgi:hypothetical protein
MYHLAILAILGSNASNNPKGDGDAQGTARGCNGIGARRVCRQ